MKKKIIGTGVVFLGLLAAVAVARQVQPLSGNAKATSALASLTGQWKGTLTYVEGDGSGRLGSVPAVLSASFQQEGKALKVQRGYPRPVVDTFYWSVTEDGKLFIRDDEGARLCPTRGLASFPKTGTFSFDDRTPEGELSRFAITCKNQTFSLVNSEGASEDKLVYKRSLTLAREAAR